MCFGKIRVEAPKDMDLIIKLKSASEPDPFVAKHIRLALVECNLNLDQEMNDQFEGVE